MSRSVSAPSSVTKTSPCWYGLIVPGSTLMYGSSFRMETRRPRALSSRPTLAAVMPLPREEVTPPVTKTYFAMYHVLRGFFECYRKTPGESNHRRRSRAEPSRSLERCEPCGHQCFGGSLDGSMISTHAGSGSV